MITIHGVMLSPFVRKARIGEYEVDAQRWPKLGAYLAYWWAEPLFAARIAAEQAFISNATAG